MEEDGEEVEEEGLQRFPACRGLKAAIPGTRVCFLSLLAVRKGFRQHGIGSYLLKQIKSPSVIGPYDALLVRAPTVSRRFFIKHGFTDDIVLSSRFMEADEADYEGSLLCYLPPFDGHYPSLPGTPEWNQPEALAAMEEEVERCHIALLGAPDVFASDSVEKKSARSLIETLEKEAADFERLCNLGQQLQQPAGPNALLESRAKLRAAFH
ncbi:hypothetical protein MRX96_025728 [Rhipicephalus microplus]